MANLLQSSQTQATSAPGFYTDHLTNIANKTAAAIDPKTGAQYIGADPLQTAAFTGVEAAADSGDTQMQTAQNTLGTAVSSTSPLSSAQNYLTNATSNVGTDATGLMSPYTANVVNSIADVGQRNIMQNLAPQATAGAVGSGQFGSKRGAEVLGQTIQNANKDILNQQYQALNTGYSDALKAAIQQNQIEATVGRTAGDLASAGQQNLTSAGRAQADTATAEQKMNLEGINALSTLGEQKRTLEQNEELFPLSNLSTAAGMLRGYNVPTTTKTTMEASPLSTLVGAGTALTGLVTPGTAGGATPLDSLVSAAKKLMPTFSGIRAAPGSSTTNATPSADQMTALENQGYKLDPDGSGYMIKDGNYYALGKDNNPVLVGAVGVVPTGVADTDIAGGGEDTMDGSGGLDTVVAGGGEDTMDGSGGLDTVEAGEGIMDGGFALDSAYSDGVEENAKGGLIRYAAGGPAGQWDTSFTPHMNIGGLPVGGMPQYDQSNAYVGYNQVDGSFVPR
tara:strand:- start:13567 stop:15087 length:1521 start_codon:yes stop_codon:yes gene_type:complete